MKDWNKLVDHVTTLFREKLPCHLTYHNIDHTLTVLKSAEQIATHENVKGNDLLLLKTAALFHDSGFMIDAKNHELMSVKIAEEKLPGFGYSSEEIKIINGMIEATTIPQNPKTQLEKILADADLDYLGTDAFEEIGKTLWQELRHFNPAIDRQRWDAMQISFLRSHHYHTEFSRKFRAPEKENNLNNLIEKYAVK